MAWSRSFLLVAIMALATLSEVCRAQTNPTLTEAERGIKDADPDVGRHLRIEELRVAAKVVGRTADVTVDLLIASDSEDDYEANLALALPADAVVTGYALNVGSALIPGQLLESPKARSIYEDEVRAGIDPGLAEVSSGNRFTTRVFPITRDNPRRIRISFVAPFDPHRGLILPFLRDVAPKRVLLELSLDDYAEAPTVTFAGAAVRLDRQGSGWRGRATASGALREGLVATGGKLARPMAVVRHSSGERFFVIDDDARIGVAKPRPGRLRIYWDRSLSHGRGNPELEARILERFVDSVTPTGIDLVTFASDRPVVTPLKDAAGLRGALAKIVYRGATSLAGLDRLSLAPASQCVLVTDGQVTIDRGTEFAPECSISVLTASDDADGARLGRIAQQSAGVFVRASGEKVAEAAAALRHTVGVTGVRDANGRRLSFRSLPAADGHWLLVGRMPDRGNVRVQLSDGSERSYAGNGAAIPADAPGALWAAQHVQMLGDDPSRHQAMVDFARRYHVAGPAMSLLVLESPDQYLRAEIAPPAGFPADWMAEYREAKKEKDETAADDRRERFEFVVKEWADRKTWWTKRFKVRPGAAAKSSASEPVPSAITPAPPPPPPAEPQASAPNSTVDAISSGSAGDVVVTGTLIRNTPLVPEAPRAKETEFALDLADLTAKRPYIVALASALPGRRLVVLRDQERTYGSLPSFYLDTAEWFRLKGDTATAELLLMSALELSLTDDETRQIVAFRLERDRNWDRSVELNEQLAAANAVFRPQPARDLALALAARGRSRGAAGRADLERAFTLLTSAALNPASSDFDGFEVVALMEANALIPDIEAAGGVWKLDPRLVALIDTDVRIVIEWTTDDADIDLWVDEPDGERVYYGDKISSAGGQISNDMTDGYGPEEYAIHRAPAGAYGVRINGYDADRLNPNGPGHVLIRLIRNFARRSERDEMVDLDLSFQQGRDRDDEDETKPVATLKVLK
jgi:hypothetical protein